MEAHQTACIQVRELSKTYYRHTGGLLKRTSEEVKALTDVSFSVAAGEMIGLIGPNGAGKSTTVKLLTGVLTPSSGSCVIDGLVPWVDRTKHVSRLGTVFGQRTQLWWDVPILDSYRLLRDIYQVDRAAWQKRLDELIRALDLQTLLAVPLRQLSLGQRMRAELCGALLHSPSLLFLDEPTIGLDATSKLRLRSYLLEENRQHGTTVFLTTHDMEDMLSLCKRVLVMGHGRLLYDGALDELLRRYESSQTLRCLYEQPVCLEGFPEQVHVERDGDTWQITFVPDKLAAVLTKVTGAGNLRELSLKEENVDRLIARMYEEMNL